MSAQNAVSGVTVYATRAGADIYITRGQFPSGGMTRLYENPSQESIGRLSRAVYHMVAAESIQLAPWGGSAIGWIGVVHEKEED